MANKTLEQATDEVNADFTSMIDVTFLLLIFFMCSIKFKVLEGKLQTYLPKDVGVNTTPAQEMLEKIDVRITRTDTREKRNLDDIDVFEDWEWNFDQVNITLNGRPMKSLDELSKELKKMRADIPPPAPGSEDEDDLKMNLEPMKGVIYEDVVKVVDIALDARFTSITFRGIEMDA